MSYQLDTDEATVLKFVQEFFVMYDKKSQFLHRFFTEDGTLILLGNRMTGHSCIEQGLLTMAPVTHELNTVDMQYLPMKLDVNMYQVICGGVVGYEGDSQTHGFTATLLVCFKRPDVLKVASYNERCQWPKLS